MALKRVGLLCSGWLLLIDRQHLYSQRILASFLVFTSFRNYESGNLKSMHLVFDAMPQADFDKAYLIAASNKWNILSGLNDDALAPQNLFKYMFLLS